MNQIYLGDCLEILPTLAENSIDLILTDPPYGLSFMGKNWDHGVPGVQFWIEALRVAKPGAHLFAFGGTRTFHRLAVAIEDAGWEIRDTIMWVYGSGFPKSHDVSKAIDKAAGAERQRTGNYTPRHGGKAENKVMNRFVSDEYDTATGKIFETAPATDAAKTWQGWGTALKPAMEMITVARKPLIGTVAENVLQWGTGGINIDGCRVGSGEDKGFWPVTQRRHNDVAWTVQPIETDISKGRWPANLIHDGSEEVVGLFPVTKPSKATQRGSVKIFEQGEGQWIGESTQRGHDDSGGSAARFFYCAKASKSERGEGNIHPTVKPLALMKYLITLGLPPGGIVLDPFAGSGTTALAALELGQKYICIEKSEEYHQIILDRIDSFNQLSLPINMY